ncbi:vacuolar membrane protein [Moesziomyces antarcticus]|uniref:Vacuolar membrane protein n=2 Tax=Pseudozyma antarctica TaxID=84753 RepID=A0A081CGC8_PSEA2|nr:vacuolar membrane protein [Moesziomyces antarcticus]GAK65724.1 vacuolar membrane protein [Moesziomyces antarcticus]SPO45350.1 related to SYM1 - protein required for ethanol metabolism [Moesziomyces antarcticus]
MSYRQAFSSFYARNFERRPWVTLAVTNGTLGVLADAAAQSLERISQAQSLEQQQRSRTSSDTTSTQPPPSAVTDSGWDWSRSGRFLAFNVGMAPLLAEWNRFLEFRFPLRAAPAATAAAGALGKVSLRALGNRVAMDQIFFAPIGLALFTGAMGAMERGSLEGVQAKFGEMYIPALLANWQIWPLVQLVNFRYMPLKYRVPFVSAVGILWNIGLSLLSQSTRPKQSPALSEKQAVQLSAPTKPPSTA